MQTKPLEDRKTGMIVFSEHFGLMAKIISIKPEGFGFHVLNGYPPRE